MFEKEAKEWVKENMDCVKTENCLNHDCNYFSDEERSVAKSAFLAGAEFSYNKAMNEAKGIIKDLLHCLPKENIEGVYEVIEAAEQFLNSEVEE